MNIFVLLKRTLDSEEEINLDGYAIETDDAEFIINPYDEYAIEEAIQLKEANGGEVTVITVGDIDAEKQLRTALAMGADKACLIELDDDISEEADATTISKLLAAYLNGLEVDLILAGNVSIDEASGQVGPMLAEHLGLAYITAVTNIEINEQAVVVEKDVEGDKEKIIASLPLLLTCQQGLNEPRFPNLPGIMKAKKKPLDQINLEDLNLTVADIAPLTKTIERFLAPKKENGKILEGSVQDQVKELVSLLKDEAKVF